MHKIMCAYSCKTRIDRTQKTVYNYRQKGGQKKKKPPECGNTQTEKGEKAMYTEYGYIGEDGIEYATEQEAYEAQTDNEDE